MEYRLLECRLLDKNSTKTFSSQAMLTPRHGRVRNVGLLHPRHIWGNGTLTDLKWQEMIFTPSRDNEDGYLTLTRLSMNVDYCSWRKILIE
ncbi:hypothetical protein J6590_017891 [Homalodisca vitripennis]|nr:hypothetical protein J6590_017891 [Homalodisca vitripennis]